MKFAGTLTNYYKDAPKGYVGILRATDSIGKNDPLDLGMYLYVLVKAATEFSLDAGIPTEEANAAIQQLKKYLEGVEIK